MLHLNNSSRKKKLHLRTEKAADFRNIRRGKNEYRLHGVQRWEGILAILRKKFAAARFCQNDRSSKLLQEQFCKISSLWHVREVTCSVLTCRQAMASSVQLWIKSIRSREVWSRFDRKLKIFKEQRNASSF